MNDSRFPIIGPGRMEICQRCTEYLRREREIEKQIADELDAHPELLNGNAALHDLLKLRRAQPNGGVGFVQEETADGHRRQATGNET